MLAYILNTTIVVFSKKQVEIANRSSMANSADPDQPAYEQAV